MSISNQVKEMLKTNKAQIELLQLAMTSSIAGLIYSEYIKNFKQVLRPVHKIFIPELRQVQELVNTENEFMTYLSDNIIERIIENELFKEFSTIEDLNLFRFDNVEILKTIVDLYVMQNISRSIPNVIARKFGIGDENNQLFIESNEIDLFQRKPLNENHFKYIVDQTVLHMLTIIPKVEKNVITVENNIGICIENDNKTILTIGNDNAISLIHFNRQIFENPEIMNILLFVTSTSISPKYGNEQIDEYNVLTNPYNQVLITRLSTPTTQE